MSYCRCTNYKCQRRRTLRKALKDYVRPPPCTGCGRNSYRVDKYRTTVERRVKACNCHRLEPHLGSLYHFPHRRGSKFCGHNKFTEAEAKKWARDHGLDTG